MNVRVLADVSALSEAAAEQIATWAAAGRGRQDPIRLALSGGATPASLYRTLADPRWQAAIDWRSMAIFWSDERCVPPGSEHSNYRLANETLLSRLAVPARSVHRMRGEDLDVDGAAQDYERALREACEPRDQGTPPVLDIVLLGLGTDGHTASLFPSSPALQEASRWIVPSESPQPPRKRITMTFPLINQARHVLFLVSGKEKAAVLARTLAAPKADVQRVPAQRVVPVNGNVTWFVDRAAAADLHLSSGEP